MASKSFSEDDFSCPVCCEVFNDPVILPCTHSICEACLKYFWATKGSRECPVCRTRSSKDEPPLNLHLRNLCETFLQQRSRREPFCSEHRSELKLYCEDDKQLVCLVCRDSKLHKNHNFSPISEAALQYREELKAKLQLIRKKLVTFRKAKETCDKTAQYITVQAQHTERQIKQEFEKLHQFLRDEEAARIASLREEEDEKSQMMNENIEKMSRKISSLTDTIRAIEEEMGADDITLLQSTLERDQGSLQDPEKISGALIDVAKHLGNLKFRVWQKMQDMVQYTPLTLDPNTAWSRLILSGNLTGVKIGRRVDHQLPDNPERFDRFQFVLGSEGFDSGAHCWDVEVGGSASWFLGVMTESHQRKGEFSLCSGVWFVYHHRGQYKSKSPCQPLSLLTVSQKPQRIRVQLDWDEGELSFSDPDRNTHIHTFTDIFLERVFPFFSPTVSLTILPVEVAVTLQ
ncbi:nuclear factor 7, brain-like [Sardina pilchardus]|uniref:nuclear factor 7, brain-like n=1 Tax=Sardina pilchardus TaxID=27697 RepID=UPI002E115E19